MKKVFKPEEHVAMMIKPYSGQWVTLSSDKSKVLGHSKKMESALSQAYQKGETTPFLLKSPDSNASANIF